MTRVLLAVALLAAISVSSRAGETVVRLGVQPMAAPKPALKYLLLPEVRELNPGNPVQWYIRCFQEQRNFFFSKGGKTERARFRAMSLSELRGGKLQNYGGNALRQVDWGARLDTPDWEVLQRVQSEGTSLRLPEIDVMQELAVALQVRFRGAVADRRFDDAVSSAKTMFAVARHLGMCPVGAANRLGLTLAGLALDTMEEMLQQPGCPNLYWALTDLPCPLVDLRKGLQGDGLRAATDLRQLRAEPMTETEIEEVISRLSGSVGYAREQAGLPPRNLRAMLRAATRDAEKVSAARARLMKAVPKEEAAQKPSAREVLLLVVRRLSGERPITIDIQKLSPTQVLLLDEKLSFEEQRDERMKLLALAPWQLAGLARNSDYAAKGFLADLLPDVVKIRQSQARLEQRIALLRHIEAVRLCAAAHDGKLPSRLSDCSVPLPDDPFTGKPFRYDVDDKIAHLRGGSSGDKAKGPAGEVHYEVTVK
jgi:hypothetical protein